MSQGQCMIKENQDLFNRLNILLDAILIFVSVPLGYWIRFSFFPAGRHILEFDYYLAAAVAYTAVQLMVFGSMHLYDAQRRVPILRELLRLTTATTIGFALLLISVFVIMKLTNFSRGALAIIFFAELALLGGKRVATRWVLREFRRRGYNLKTVLLIGSGDMAKRFIDEIRSKPYLGYRILGYVAEEDRFEGLERLGGINRLTEILDDKSIEEVYAALDLSEYEHLPYIIASCEAKGLRFSLIPCFAGYMPVKPHVDYLNNIPMMNLRNIPLDNVANAFVKRLIDIVGSIVLILLTSPLMIITAIGVKISSPGPVLFRQERVGRDRKPFSMYKFRSMRINDCENSGWSTNTDPRRTPFGSFIRKYSIDELPQFFNVLKGEMSLVGPRPELPYFVEQFSHDVPRYMVKHQVRPGITGWAQVHGLRGDTSIPQRIDYDLYYIEHWSLLLDIRILLMTFRHIRNEEILVASGDKHT